MNIRTFFRPKQTLDYLKWYDILVLTLILFGQFIYRSTELYLQSLAPVTQAVTEVATTTTTDTASSGAAYSSNFTLQVSLLIIAFLYLWIRNFNFKRLPIKFKWSVLFWVPFIFAIMGLMADTVTSLSGSYNYFSWDVIRYINPLAIIDKFLALSPMAIAYSLLNGFYEEFFFLGLLTSVKEHQKWWVLLYSTIVRISFHTYQGMLWALTIGVLFGLLYYFFYKFKVKNLLPFFLVHALADMFGSGLIYLLINWGS
ncbi:hypothetical protein STRDD10_00567 [Streptococcus sp. DD10]|uniref:CPBP family intramembrane glutamic endopeptidase n=1 Tax=Streptococcus sp. DD10 TaxID=1777878 RepID=UPI0007988992|nr:CPBP family intramembrane glutamic endopeptidase [Streptococcus sp. DD10]KXT74953.1 hypothetical protein STRDD10_00567 [Streptococcus sp. DD10]